VTKNPPATDLIIDITPPTAGEIGLAAINRSIRYCMLAGFSAIVLCFGGLGTWAALAPLESAVIAEGVVIVDSRRKTVQHLEDGIIKEIAVREGDMVGEGDILIRLEDTMARTTLALHQGRYYAALAERGRLEAERDGAAEISFAAELPRESDHPKIRAILDNQKGIFEARRASWNGQLTIYDEQIRQFEEEIVGLEAQVKAGEEQIEIIREELEVVSDLFKKGFETKRRLLALRREGARLKGTRGAYLGRIAETRRSIAQKRLEKTQVHNKIRDQVVAQLSEADKIVADLEERMQGAADVLSRIDIRAPQSGVVVDLKFHTPGGVIKSGQPILDIVPQNDAFVIQSKIQPDDIESVHTGLPATVHFTAYSSRKTPTIDGEVVYVSADRFTEPQSQAPYYAAHIRVDPEVLKAHPEVAVAPGMSASVMIRTGARTALDYVFDPLTYSFMRAFREE
jgi:HlyD family type I secretion membrane fusion protein